MEKYDKIVNYVNDQIARADARARGYTIDPRTGKSRAQRNAYVKIDKYMRDFRVGVNRQNRWIAISGLRGTGKTTLMAQLYCELKVPKTHKLFISVDHIVQLLGSDITEAIQTYEMILGAALENSAEPLFLFIDEVQYDTKWALALKSIYDRAQNVFIVTTGSSALEINANSDTARRVIIETLLPMSFAEYQKISNGIFEERGLGKMLRNAFILANNAVDIYNAFDKARPLIAGYWSRVDRLEINKYLQYGTLPFMAAVGNPALAFDLLERSVDRIIGTDVSKIGKFDADTIIKVPQVLYSVADSDQISLNSLEKITGLTRPTLASVFRALEQAEVLYQLKPNSASHSSQSRQPNKYMFTTPAIRAMYFTLTGSTKVTSDVAGHLLEDAVVLYLRRLFGDKSLTNSITYGDTQGSADFIVRNTRSTFVIETGMRKKTLKQIYNTPNVSAGRIGIVVSDSELSINPETNTVVVPLGDFLLM
jgi:predicted AAA+ superfamily ATPase